MVGLKRRTERFSGERRIKGKEKEGGHRTKRREMEGKKGQRESKIIKKMEKVWVAE